MSFSIHSLLRQSLIAGTLCLALAAPGRASTLSETFRTSTLSETFEDGTITPFRQEGMAAGHTATIEAPTFGARNGTNAHKIVWYQSKYDGTRASSGVEGHSAGNPRITSEGWYAFSFYLPSGQFPTNKNLIIGQLSAWTRALPKTNKTIVVSINATGSLELKTYYGLGQGDVVKTGAITLWGAGQTANNLDRWHDVIVYVKFSNNDTGTLKVWFNGASEGQPTGVLDQIKVGNGAWTSANLMTDGAYVKWGIYAWDIKNYTPGETRTIYFDDIDYLVGNPIGAFDAVKPLGYGITSKQLIRSGDG